MERIESDFTIGLGYMKKALDNLKLINYDVANEVTRDVTEISGKVIRALIDTNFSSKTGSPYCASVNKSSSDGSTPPRRSSEDTNAESLFDGSQPDDDIFTNATSPISRPVLSPPSFVLNANTLPYKPYTPWIAPKKTAARSPVARSTWATVASIAPDYKAEKTPSDSQGVPAFPLARASFPTQPSTTTTESLAEQARVVWIDPAGKLSYRDISRAVEQGGAINSICFLERAKGRVACIVFQSSSDANAYASAERRKVLSGISTLGTAVDIRLGERYPTNGSIASMGAPTFARRRLTIAKKGLMYQISREQLQKDIYRWAGELNVELLYLYNAGNVTVILASVECARLVKEAIEKRACQRRPTARDLPYVGASVSYSKDPTEGPMRLVSVYPDEKDHYQ